MPFIKVVANVEDQVVVQEELKDPETGEVLVDAEGKPRTSPVTKKIVVENQTLNHVDYIYPVDPIVLKGKVVGGNNPHIYCDKTLGRIMVQGEGLPVGGVEVKNLGDLSFQGRARIVKSGGSVVEAVTVKSLSK